MLGFNAKIITGVVIAIVIGLAIGLGIAYLPFHGLNGNPSSSVNTTSSTSNNSTVYITMVEETSGPLAGINGSYYKGATQSWPIVTVLQGQSVTIHVVNEGSSEPHGFAISHYFNNGVTVTPGESYDVKFVATDVGNFTIYCNVFCSIHPFMQSGVLIVKQ